eukprot:TRINITY_DN1798_c0_g1_i3.p1 TRINITY_DN1798_c0_g1~~TRINITY_DN1798_c0_g1_i3.p1  ORF type:complete len:259 (-),score=1.25 TRINITY_DN1798_c0_g1_i3:136-912(-)
MSPLVWKGHLCVFTFVFYLQFSCMSAQPTHPSLSCSDHSSCSSCVGVHLNTEYCGWCSEAETCMNGNFSGPTNGNCVNWEWYGDSWTDFGGKCCSDRNNCTDCINDHNPKHECSWCMDNEQCLSSSSLNFLSCSALLNESCCDSYTKCTECNAVNGCSWCLDSMSCKSEDTFCNNTAGKNCCFEHSNCQDCQKNTDCQYCTSDMQCQQKGSQCSTQSDRYCCWENSHNCTGCNQREECSYCKSTRECFHEEVQEFNII